MKDQAGPKDKTEGQAMGSKRGLNRKAIAAILNMTVGRRSFAGQLKAAIQGSSTTVETAES
jgi:hypothetical protein